MLASLIATSVAVSGTLSKQVPLASSIGASAIASPPLSKQVPLASSIGSSVLISGNISSGVAVCTVTIVANLNVTVVIGIIPARSSIKCISSAAGNLSVIRKRDINDVLPAHLVEQQFPSFIRDDYPKMVEFVRAYYDYMAETENGRIENLRNIDETSGDYLNYLQNEYLYNAAKPNFEQDFAAEDFIRYSRQFYAAKGTEESIKFLFRAQESKEIEIEYPSELIFKPSTAQWYQEQSIKVSITENSNSIPATYFIGGYLTIRNNNGEEQTIEISNVIDLTQKVASTDLSTEFEIFFTTELIIDVQVGNELFATNFSAKITPSISEVDIIDAGSNFRVGQVVKLDGITGSGAVAIITKVLDGGAIRNLKLIKFGSSYDTNFYLGIEPEGVFTNTGASFTVPSIDGVIATTNRALTDVTEGFLETKSVLRSDYVLNDSGTGIPKVLDAFPFYTYPGYDGKYVSQLSNRQVFYLEENYSALLLCKIGAVCKYPGKYLDQTGMPSNASVLQDNNYYQDFSYVIKSNIDIENYRDTITALAHPAGFKMFGDLSIDNEFYSDTTAGDSDVVTNQVPSLYLDFISSNTLDPRITFTRASSGTYFDSAGVLQTAATNAPRFDYNPSTLAAQGLLIEESRTNSIRNNTMVGATIGTPGTVPTNWIVTNVLNGISRSVTAIGVEDGINYIDIRYFGTASATSGHAITTESTTQVVAATGQSWTGSVYVKLIAGSLANLVLVNRVNGRDAGGVNLETLGTGNLTPTNAALRTQRAVSSGTFANASTVRATQQLSLSYNAGAVVDVTIRVGMPQLELGAFATSVISTTTAAATRAADVANMTGTNFSNWYNQSEGTFYSVWVLGGDITAAAVYQADDGIGTNLIRNRYAAAGTSNDNAVIVGGSNQAILSATNNLTLYTKYTNAMAYKANDFARSSNGGAIIADTTGSVPAALSRLLIGNDSGTSYLGGHIQQIAYYRSRLSDAQLQSITT